VLILLLLLELDVLVACLEEILLLLLLINLTGLLLLLDVKLIRLEKGFKNKK